MKEKIKKICQSIEKEKSIKILFAVENGSRAWRISSKDSDYDVRFVFVRPLSEYVQINRPSEVINLFFDKNGKQVGAESALIDVSGFDVFKYVKMLSSSNPTTIEWLASDIIYYGEQNKIFNYLKYLKSGADVTYKRYLYAFRGLINAKWVAYNKDIPPINFDETLSKSISIIPEFILRKLYTIIKLKLEGREKEIVENIVKMDEYTELFLKDDLEAPNEKPHSTLNELNAELRKIVFNYK